ncbi:TVC1 protein, partial [Crocuta crocuta]
LEQPEISISRARGKSARISCKMSNEAMNTVVHWYRQKPDQGIEHLTYVSTSLPNPSGTGSKKFEASTNAQTSTATLTINFLEETDEAVYYCACWDWIHSIRDARRS